MSSVGSVTQLLEQLKNKDQEGIRKIWDLYSDQLMRLARRKLQGTVSKVSDEEDVVLSAFESFCQGAEKGNFAQLKDRDDLWHLLVLLTVRKAKDIHEFENRKKRKQPTSGEGAAGNGKKLVDVNEVCDPEPPPDLLAQLVEECQHRLEKLGNMELQSIALWKMEGFTNREIASKLGCVERTVERKIMLIKSLWCEEEAQ
jgi:DNA-directed RNA polymerase specialized sigma24 family protein